LTQSKAYQLDFQKQLEKQIDVKEVEQLEAENAVIREHAIIKVFSTPENRMSIVAVADIFRANVIDVSKDSLMVEMTGDSTKVDAFVEIVKPFGIKQIVRSGITALKRG
jgi:acetolactate synthase-1/3 small subunit